MADQVMTGRTTGLLGVPRRFWVLGLALTAIFAALGLHASHPPWSPLPASVAAYGAGTLLAIVLAAFLCEYIDSSLGMGYGTTLTPLMILVGFDPRQVVPCVLVSELVTGIAATLMHHRDGNVDFFRNKQARWTAILLSALSTVGAVAAVSLAVSVNRAALSTIIGVIILVTGVATLATIRRQLRYRPSHIIGIGAIAAFNKGLSGGGYGPLVTAGQVVSGVSSKHAVAITSLAESFTCLVGLIAYLVLGEGFNWSLALPLACGALMSVPLATLTVRRMPDAVMRASVGCMTCALAVYMFYKLLT
jgi:uncharacterized membrane protein YfcA